LLGTAGALLLIPAFTLLLQVVLAARPVDRSDRKDMGPERPHIAVLVPAHDEATVLAETLRALRAQLRAGDRLVVIADNCADDTANIAASEGAEVAVRDDPSRRGKGYALDYGVRFLENDPPEVVLIIDADCLVQGHAVDRLARRCKATGHPVQAAYLMTTPPDAGLGMRIAALAWLLRNYVRPLGFARIGLPCQLMGSGMAFHWADIRSAELASGHIVEDMVLGLQFAQRGIAPLFAPEARVTSIFPEDPVGLATQRARWEHGHLGVILKDAPRHLLNGIRERNIALLALVADLCIPPLALLGMLVTADVLLATALHSHSGTTLPLVLALAGFAMLAAAGTIFWATHGKTLVPFSALVHVPWYAVRKVPLYLKFIAERQIEWVRSKRKDE
jgi:cellulose synthase/poly-beta-1,6-N-acetylglucosamine synthase-like glycosyltransferase